MCLCFIAMQQTHMATLHYSLLVLTLCILSVSSQLVFLSIDCGGSSSSDSYRDENLIVWNGDSNYTSTGESRVVGSGHSVSRVMDSLRVFNNDRKKNCYHVHSVRQGRVLVRASFNYGNYDNRSAPPTFDLQFDGNHWTTVETSSSGSVSYEVIYVMKRDTISICVAQTRRGEFPFISALEIRGLELFMYGTIVNVTRPLFLISRIGYGLDSPVRYGDDPYDRIWTPAVTGNGVRVLNGNTTFSEIPQTSDLPPPAVLQNAITALTPNSTIYLLSEIPPNVYISWYFTEVTRLRPNETRSFEVFRNNNPFIDPIEPPYNNCTQWIAYGYNEPTNTTYSLVPTNISTLPPLINAMEMFEIGQVLTTGTNRNDVEGLNSLRDNFSVLGGWTGDPCLPAGSNWDWIECSNNTEPRVTALLLSSFGLSGQLPSFSSMGALQTIDFHNNSLSGRIPEFLDTLPRLTQLNLADNQFVGLIPDSLYRKNGLNLVVTGNSGLCTSDNSSCATSTSSRNPTNSSGSNKLKNHLPIAVDSAIAFFVIILFIMY